MTNRTNPNTDVLDIQFVGDAVRHEGPWVSIFLPTQRTGRETMAALSQFQNLLKLAEQELKEKGHGDLVDEILAPARELTADHRDFWRNQADGLAVYAAPGVFRTFRLPIQLPDEVAVGDAPRLSPVAELLSTTGLFYLLALSNNDVRLFEATRSTIGELELRDDAPVSADDVHTDRDHQEHLQSSPQSAGGDRANFHGHGGDDNAAEVHKERFFRYVAEEVEMVIDRTVAHPIVLATVEGNQSLYRAVSKHRQLLDDFVAGSPDKASPEDLHAKAFPIALKATEADDDALVERFGALVGTGKASDDLSMIARAAAEGRVEALIVQPQSTQADGQVEVVQDEADDAIVQTLRNGGSITVIKDESAPAVRAIYRY